MTDTPSLSHLERHIRDPEDYRARVTELAAARFDGTFWGAWAQYVSTPAHGAIVDLGVGSGFLLEALRARYPEARLIGVDVLPHMLELARPAAERAGAELVQADLGLPVPLPDGAAQVVISSMVLHELPYPPALLANAARLLAPGGRLVLLDIVRWPVATYLAGRELEPDGLAHFQEHGQFTPEDVAWLVGQSGLIVDEWVTRHSGRFVLLHAHKPA